jgi:hypothetical protein
MQDEIKTQPSDTGDHISLSTVRNAFLDFSSFLFGGLEFIVSSIRKSLLIFFLCCLIGVAVGYLYYRLSPKYYTSEMILNHNDLSRKDYYEIINNLNSLVLTQSYSDLEKELGLKEEITKKIRSLEVLKMNGETLAKDTSTKIGQPFKIQIRFSDKIETSQLQNSIINYLNNNPYLKLTKEGQKKIFEGKLAFIEREQEKLDSLKSLYNVALASSKMSQTFYNNAMNPADIYVQSNSLANQKDAILRWLNNEAKAIVLIDGLKTPAYIEKLPRKFVLAAGLGGGIVLGFFISFMTAIGRQIQARRLVSK